MLKWVSTATRHSAWLSTAITATTNTKTSIAATITRRRATVARMLTCKSTSINSTIWLLTTLYIIAALIQATNGFKPIEMNNSEGRKLFGGYRITPKHCRATKTLAMSDPRKNGQTICMFNHECAQRNGEVVGACMDGFLFGACCQIPSEQDLVSTLLNDAQNAYYQQHQQQKLQEEYGGANQAVAQSYETYGESQQQQSQETKYTPPTFKPKSKPTLQRIQKPQKQQQKYKPQQPKPNYGDVDNAASTEVKQTQNGYTQTNIDKVYQQLENVNTYEALHAQSEETLGNQYQQSQESAPPNVSTQYVMEPLSSVEQKIRPGVGPIDDNNEQAQSAETESQMQQQQISNESEATDSSSAATDVSTQSSSMELEKDAQLHIDQEVSNTNFVHNQVQAQAQPVQAPFTTLPPAPLNDDFVLDLLSTTLPPSVEEEPISLTTTGLPMRIVNGLTEPNSSSESNSFEEPPVTENPSNSNEWHKNAIKEAAKPKPKPQTQRPRPPVKLSRPQAQQQKPKPQQQQSNTRPNHNHLILDGAHFTHSDITHPGADADLIEDDLQFSTGYGPQPVYMEAPAKQPSPISYNPSSTTAPKAEDNYAAAQSVNYEQSEKRPSEPTPSTSITTHVDSIESIILQLNGTTNNGPTYNIVNQQLTQTASYGSDDDASNSKYEPTESEYYGTTSSSMAGSSSYAGGLTTNYYDDVETKRPNDYYAETEQPNAPNYAPVTAQVPAYLEPVTTNLNIDSSPSTYGSTASVSQQQPVASYAEDTAGVLDEHTMPANNYNDVLQASSHQTHEFNKMPAVGIAYPVDMSHMEGESNSTSEADSNYDSIDKEAQQATQETSYAQVPVISGKPQRPTAAYTDSQIYNGVPLPQEVSVSSQTTKVQDINASSMSYHTSKPESLTTIQYVDENIYQRPTISKTTTSAYLTPSTTPAPPRPQYSDISTVASGIITSSGTRPRPRPRPKPSTTRPNTKRTKPSAAKNPTTAQQLINNNQAAVQPPSSYGQTDGHTKQPVPQPTNNYQVSNNTPVKQQPVKQTVKQPAATYQHNKPTYVKRPSTPQQPSSNFNAKPASNTLNVEPVYQRPEQQLTYEEHLSNSYVSTSATRKPGTGSYQGQAENNKSPVTYGQVTKLTSGSNYAENFDKPDAVNEQKVPQPTIESDAYYPAPQPSLNFDNEQQNAATNRPAIIRKTSVPTTMRPSSTVIYHDSEVPPLIVADDKLDSFANGEYNYQSQPQYAQRPQNTYVHKKPGFVKVTSKPITTTNDIITQKPTLFTIVTNNGWPQRPNFGSSIYIDNAYPQTTPLPAFSSTSYIYSPLVTRRPELTINTPEYGGGLSGVTSNDFDDPGYYGAQHVVQNVQSGVHPAFTQTIGDTEYGVPSDDLPAFPGYFGPTPTYPPFPIPGEKLGSQVEEETYTSPNDFVNFPPVRNPNLNMSATSSAVTTDLELSTPAFVEDGVLKDKMNTLVHKIVESLQGNFDALADMIDDVNNTASTAPISTYQAPGAGAVTTRKPTRKPTRIATTKPTTKRPATRVTTKQPTRKPAATTQRPVTRRTTIATRRPTTRKPTRRTTTTTTTQASIADDLIDEEDEEDVNPAENEIGSEQEEVVTGAGGRKFKCGVRPHIKSGRIVGGKGSTFGAFPWQVLVRESTWLGLFTKNKCGGVLITNRYVVTAAHCQPGFLASLVAVLGEFDISGDLESKRAVTKNVKRVIVHRQYDPATFENDLALLELESPVQYDTHIVPICIPNDHADFTGRMATVTGWGRLKYGGGVPSVLQEVQVPIIENSVCQEMFHTAGHNKKILGSFLCAGYANGQKDSCEGDSGGPLVLQRPDGRYELAGTVSHGIKCAAPYLPGVYMRTTFYKPWLRSITGVK